MDILYGATKSPRDSLEKAIELAQTVIAQDDNDPYGHALLGWLYCFKKDFDTAIAEGERGVALNPSGSLTRFYYGQSLIYVGKPEEAVPVLQKAVRLNPFGPDYLYLSYGSALRMTGRFEEAVSAYKKVLQRSPNNIFAHLGLAATYSITGREQEARAEAAEVLRINPKFSVDSYAKRLLFKDQSETDKVVNALRKAGLK